MQLDTGAADYAECLPQADADEWIEPADVIGVGLGEVARATADAEQALVVSDQPVVTGNPPG